MIWYPTYVPGKYADLHSTAAVELYGFSDDQPS